MRTPATEARWFPGFRGLPASLASAREVIEMRLPFNPTLVRALAEARAEEARRAFGPSTRDWTTGGWRTLAVAVVVAALTVAAALALH